jgi:predicted CoA-substrate-specific enzyme activase
MISAGIDVGSRTTKIVILDNATIISKELINTGWRPVESAQTVYKDALQKSGINESDIAIIIATGYGRVMLPFANETVTEITCHARGARFINSDIHTVIDIGGQDSKVIRIDAFGFVEDFAMNDRCAAGTGKFLEFLAHTLGTDVFEFGKLALASHSPSVISSMCTVFAESEILSLLAERTPIPDIVAGLHRAIAQRIEGLVDLVGYSETVALTGGVAHNAGIHKQLETLLHTSIFIPEYPEYVGALGAALSGLKKEQKGCRKPYQNRTK